MQANLPKLGETLTLITARGNYKITITAVNLNLGACVGTSVTFKFEDGKIESQLWSMLKRKVS